MIHSRSASPPVLQVLTLYTGLRSPPPNRLDLHEIPRRHRKPRPLLPIHKPNLRPALRHVLANQTAHENRKDSVINAESTGHFVWNLATYDLREAVNITAEQVPYVTDEFARAGLEKENAELMDVPMVKASPVKFECAYHSTLRLPANPPMGTVDVVIGRVVGVHVSEDVLTDGRIDVRKTKPIARCGYFEYAVVRIRLTWLFRGEKIRCMGWRGVRGRMGRWLRRDFDCRDDRYRYRVGKCLGW